MHLYYVSLIVLLAIAPPILWSSESANLEGSENFATVLLNAKRLESVRCASPDSFLGHERQALLDRAFKLLEERTTYSVTYNAFIPEGATINDYYSMGPYWWPNPDTANGLPYVRRDGKVNPERDLISDYKPLHAMIEAVNTVALAYSVTGNEDFSEFGTKLLRTWFLDPGTKMNPHMRYAQGIPGRSSGRNFGIIDSLPFIQLVDSIALLQTASIMDDKTVQGLNAWFLQYLNWLREDPFGKEEATRRNNHSTSYDLQVLVIALSLGESDWARSYIQKTTLPRLESQIEADGSQPEELARTKSWNYACGNLHHFMRLGLLGRGLGVDLFQYPDPDDPTLKRALDFVLLYVDKPGDWPCEMIVDWKPERLRHSLAIACVVYQDPAYTAEIERLGWMNLPISEYLTIPFE